MTAPNRDQQSAIDTTSGPLLVIAGPGAGKTFTLVERIVRLIEVQHIDPSQLLVVTFTEKAARELITRISNRLIELGISFNINEMYIGTFHSVCLRLLKDHREFTGLKRNFSLFDQFDQQYFLYQRLSRFDEIDDSINTEAGENCPQVSPDGRYFFFNRYDPDSAMGNMYWVDVGIIETLRPPAPVARVSADVGARLWASSSQ